MLTFRIHEPDIKHSSSPWRWLDPTAWMITLQVDFLTVDSEHVTLFRQETIYSFGVTFASAYRDMAHRIGKLIGERMQIETTAPKIRIL